MDGYSAIVNGRYSRSYGRLKRFGNIITTTWGTTKKANSGLDRFNIKVLAPPAKFFVKYSPSRSRIALSRLEWLPLRGGVGSL